MIIVILIASAILRLVSINQSLWLDEAININNATSLDFKTLILNYSLGDFHPPLYHVVIKSWILLFGNSEIAVRIPSVIFGVITVYFTYQIAKKLFEEKTALIAATLIGTAPLSIYYSQEARMYSLAAMLTAMSVYFLISLLKKDKLIYWIGFILSTVLMLYTDYLPYIMLPILIIYLFQNRKTISKHTLFTFIPAYVAIAILISPWLFVFQKQIKVGLSAAAASPAWAQVVGKPDLKSLTVTFVKFTIGRISIDNDLTYALVFAPIAVFLVFLFIFSFFRMSCHRAVVWYWFIGPILIGYLIGYIVPVFAYFRFLYILPAFSIIWASAINTINWTPMTRALLTIALAINLVSSIIYFSSPKFQRENWRDATKYVQENLTPKTIILFESNFTTGPFDYYNKTNIPAAGALNDFTAAPVEVKQKVADLTKDKDKVFLFQYLSQITDPQGIVFEDLTNLGFNNTSTKDFSGVGFVYEFRR